MDAWEYHTLNDCIPAIKEVLLTEKSLHLQEVQIVFLRDWIHEFKGRKPLKAELDYIALNIGKLYV